MQEVKKSMGIDPSFGYSHFAIVVAQYENGKIQIIFAEQYDRDHSHFEDMIMR